MEEILEEAQEMNIKKNILIKLFDLEPFLKEKKEE